MKISRVLKTVGLLAVLFAIEALGALPPATAAQAVKPWDTPQGQTCISGGIGSTPIAIAQAVLPAVNSPGVAFGQAADGGITITATYGPPSAANKWEKFTIPLTAAAFKVDDTTFRKAISNVKLFRISTEMSDSRDIGSLDSVSVGTRFSSNFDSGPEGWSGGGDGTMEWISAGGISGGYLQVSDWGSGDWHWMVAPINWSGDWSNLIGSSIVFYMKTDHPDYDTKVEISSAESKRLILSADPLIVPLNGTSALTVSLTDSASQDVVVTLSSSDTNCITVPSSVTIRRGQSSAQSLATAASGARADCTAVIEASTSGYSTSRITLRVGGQQPGEEQPVPGNDLPLPPFGSPEPASVARMTLQAGQRRVVEGGLVNVPVWLINGKDVANTNFTVDYDGSVAVPEGDLIKGSLLDRALFEFNTAEADLIRIGFAQTTGVNGTGTVTYVPFRAVGKAGDRTELHLEVTTINNPGGTVLTIDRIDGAIQIVGPDGLVPGDCNNDGSLNEYDASCALQISVRLRPVILALDLDNSGDVTSRDATVILQRANRPLGTR